MAAQFQFLDTGRLAEGELELVSPQYAYVDEMLASAQHPLTVRQDPREAYITRQQLIQFVQNCPLGRQPPDPLQAAAPTYYFWMYINRFAPEVEAMRLAALRSGHPIEALHLPRVSIAGTVSLRVGSSDDLELYYGHIGYHVYPPARGRHYAERSVRLLLPLARRHGMRELWITCNPDNPASRRTCERLGAVLVETVRIPGDHLLFLRGERHKCRYRLAL